MAFIPIVIGVGDIINRSLRPEDAREPLDLMTSAIQLAFKDAGLSNEHAKSLDSLDIVPTWTWPYPDLPGLLSKNLGCDPKHKFQSDHGGNQPAKLFDDASKRIAAGMAKLAVIVGGEALASLGACVAAKQMPPKGWTKLDKNIDSRFSPTTRDLGDDLGAIHGIGAPIHVYPLYENGFRERRKQSPRQNNEESAQLYADFAKVAEKNEQAWQYGKPALSKEVIGTVGKKNRMICSPYPLLMNAFNNINLAGACLLTSTENAKKLGIPPSHWIYPLGGAGTKDSYSFWERPNFYSSPSISRSLDAALSVSGLSKDQIDLFDFYSCFPIVPKLACEHLGLPIIGTADSKPITLLGGLTSFGGAGNNYSMHALIEMVRKLRVRENNASTGLILANGGTLTYQHVVCLSSTPRNDGSPYPQENILPETLTDTPVPAIEKNVKGQAVIETYTVEFKKDGTPQRGFIVGRMKSSGHRFVANHGDEATLAQLASTSEEQIGREGWVSQSSETGEGEVKGHVRNLFVFGTGAKL